MSEDLKKMNAEDVKQFEEIIKHEENKKKAPVIQINRKARAAYFKKTGQYVPPIVKPFVKKV